MNRETKTILFAVGGTGGHLYPAIGAAQELLKRNPALSILFAGGGLKSNRFFKDYPFKYTEISSGNSLSNLLPLIKGVFQSIKLLKTHKPAVVVGLGSYYSLPLLIAARLKGIPIVLLAQDSIPGRVIRLFSRFATCTGVVFPEAKRHLKGSCKDVTMPLRKGYRSGSVPIKEAKDYFALQEHLPVVLVFGGSQGALAVNQLFIEGLKPDQAYQILHFTGHPSETEKLLKQYSSLGIPSCVKDFEDRMDLAWSAADVVISRSGAMSVAEQLEFEVPGILIPYPHGTDNHQETNADLLVNAGGAIKLIEKNTTSVELHENLSKILAEKKAKSANLRKTKAQSSRQDFCDLILQLIHS